MRFLIPIVILIACAAMPILALRSLGKRERDPWDMPDKYSAYLQDESKAKR